MNEIQTLLKSSLPSKGDPELRRDLWSDMQKRIEAEEGQIRFAPFDWAIAGWVTASILISPGLIPRLLYHL